MHLRKYICSTGRKEASRSECYETLDVGCPASCVSHLLYLNTVGVAGQFFRQRFRRVECEISSRPASPGNARRPAIRRHPAVIRLEATATVIIRSRHSWKISLAPPERDRSTCRYRNNDVVGLSLGKFDNFQPFAPARTWAQL